jgi:hypothetical protein
MALSKVDGTNFVDPTLPVASGGTGLTSGFVNGGVNTPAFEAYLNATVVVSDATDTKVAIATEVFDSDGCYDSSTNYRFTPTTAGKYFVYGAVQVDTDAVSAMNYGVLVVKKNGTTVFYSQLDGRNNNLGYSNGLNVAGIIDMNGSSDYVELWATLDSGSAVKFAGDSTSRMTNFGAYRILT